MLPLDKMIAKTNILFSIEIPFQKILNKSLFIYEERSTKYTGEH